MDLSGQSEIDSTQIINSEWYRFYKNQNSKLNAMTFNQFEVKKNFEYIQGNIHADYDPGFSECNKSFIIESPDRNKYIDFLSYSTLIDSKDSCKILGFDIDQEVNLVDRVNKTVKRIRFSGSIETIEDAVWINSSKVILFCQTADSKKGIKLFFECFNFENNQYSMYMQPDYYQYVRSYLNTKYGFKD